MDNSRDEKNNQKIPLEPDPRSPNDRPAKPDIKPMYEKEWDDAEDAAGEALDKRDQKKKENNA